MSLDQRPSGKWRARWREHPGGPQKSRTFANKTQAREFLKGVQVDLARGDYVDPSVGRSTTVGVFAEGWMASQPWRGSTRDRNQSMWRTHLEPEFGSLPIASVRTSTVQAFVGRLRGTLAPATVEGIVRLLSSIFAAAVLDGVVKRNPVSAVRMPTEQGEVRTPLTRDEVAAIAEHIDPRLELAVRLAAVTGLRQGELFGLTWDRVDASARELVIDRQLVTPGKGEVALGPVKTARSLRRVPVPDALTTELGDGPAGEFVFLRDGAPWRRSRAAEALKAACEAAEVEASGWHALRHHAASVLIAEGLSVTAVAATLGHSPTECLRTYAGWWPSEHELVRAAMTRATA